MLFLAFPFAFGSSQRGIVWLRTPPSGTLRYAPLRTSLFMDSTNKKFHNRYLKDLQRMVVGAGRGIPHIFNDTVQRKWNEYIYHINARLKKEFRRIIKNEPCDVVQGRKLLCSFSCISLS